MIIVDILNNQFNLYWSKRVILSAINRISFNEIMYEFKLVQFIKIINVYWDIIQAIIYTYRFDKFTYSPFILVFTRKVYLKIPKLKF